MTSLEEHPYSTSREVRGMVFVAGSLSVDASYRPVAGRTQALDAALANLTERLAGGGLELRDVVKLTYFVTDITLRDEANIQLIERFEEPRPARTFVGVSALPYGATVEIEAIATSPRDVGEDREGRDAPR